MKLTLLLITFLMFAACRPDETSSDLVLNQDHYCAGFNDLKSCQEMAPRCQPAFESLELDISEPVFATCIANTAPSEEEVFRSPASCDQRSKVKLCHTDGNHYTHTVIIECDSVGSHADHPDDYLGPCRF